LQVTDTQIVRPKGIKNKIGSILPSTQIQPNTSTEKANNVNKSKNGTGTVAITPVQAKEKKNINPTTAKPIPSATNTINPLKRRISDVSGNGNSISPPPGSNGSGITKPPTKKTKLTNGMAVHERI
jgi:hypothetical protein